ncbi:MAG: hypothetical protein ACOVOX_13260, partial [Burkholderiaceae bacterium]
MTSRDKALPANAPSQLSLFAEAVVPVPTSLVFASTDGAVTRADQALVSASPSPDFPGSSGASSNNPLASTSPAVPMQAIFRHPQAEREIRFGEHVVAYALRRAKRRSIGFIVGAEGLSVNAPKWVGVGD